MSANINTRNHQENKASELRRALVSPLISRTIPIDPPSANRAAMNPMRRFQLETDMRRESLAFFRKLDHGHADVSYDLLSNEWNDMMNDPLIDHDADSPIPKHPPKRPTEKFQSSTTHRRVNALNSTPLRQSVPLSKSSPFAPSPKMSYDTELEDTLEMDTIGPPALSAGSLKALENLSPMQPPRAKFDFNQESSSLSVEERPERITIPARSSGGFFHPGSPGSRKNRVIVVPTAPKSPERSRKPSSSPSRFNKLSPQKAFPRSTLGTPPRFQGFSSLRSPIKSHPAGAINYYPVTPTRQSVNIAATPSRIHEHKPLDSQEEETALSPPKLDFEGVLASYNDDDAAVGESESDDVVQNPSQDKAVFNSSQPSLEAQSQDFAKQPESNLLTSEGLDEHTSDTNEIPLSPSQRMNDGAHSSTEHVSCVGPLESRRQSTCETGATEHVDDQLVTDKSEPTTPQRLVRPEDPGSNSSIKRVKDFWENLAASSAERLASVKRSLDAWSPSTAKQQIPTASPLKRHNSTLESEQEENIKWRRLTDSPSRHRLSGNELRSDGSDKAHSQDALSELSSGNILSSRLNNVGDDKADQSEEGDSDKENQVNGWKRASFKHSVSSLPSFRKNDTPVARRHTEEFRKLITPDRATVQRPESKSVEAQDRLSDLAEKLTASRNLVKELKRHPLPQLDPVSERRSSRNLLDALGYSTNMATSNTSDEIIRKRGDFRVNCEIFEEESSSKSKVQATATTATLSSSSPIDRRAGRAMHDKVTRPSPSSRLVSPREKAAGVAKDDSDCVKLSIPQQDSKTPQSKSRLGEERWNGFISPKRPTKALIAETPIPQTPKSAMLFAERKLTRGSGLDYASLPTPVRPTAKEAMLAKAAKDMSEPTSSAISRTSPRAKTSVTDHISPAPALKAELDGVATERDGSRKIEKISSTESSDTHVDHSARQSHEQEKVEGTLEVGTKRKHEEEVTEERRHRRKVYVNPIPVSQRPSRIPIATWRLKQQQKI